MKASSEPHTDQQRSAVTATRAYSWAFAAALLVSWSPGKAVAYVLPVAVLAWLVVTTPTLRLLRNVVVLACLGVLSIGIGFATNPDFVPGNAVLAMVTYSAIPIVLAIPNSIAASRSRLIWMLRITAVVVIVQSVIGLTQLLVAVAQSGTLGQATGDAVEGTIHLALAPSLSFSNVMYSANITFLTIGLLSTNIIDSRLRSLGIVMGIIGMVAASVMHVTLMFAASMLGAAALGASKLQGRKVWLGGLGVGVLVVASALVLVRQNLPLVTLYAERFADPPVVQPYSDPDWSVALFSRPTIIRRTVLDLPDQYPFARYVGVGPGQATSRASLIATGEYLSGASVAGLSPLLGIRATRVASEYLLDLWHAIRRTRYPFGSTFMPFFSWLSVFAEFGILGLLAVLTLLGYTLRQLKGTGASAPPGMPNASYWISVGVILLALLGLQENYWEVPQAILPGLLLFKATYATQRVRGAQDLSQETEQRRLEAYK